MTDNQEEKNSEKFKRIQEIISFFNFKNHSEFGKAINVSKSYLSEIFKSRKIPKTFGQKLEDSIGVSRRWLEEGDGEMILGSVISNAKYLGEIQEDEDGNTKFIELSPGYYRMKVDFVDERAKAGFLLGFSDPTYHEELPVREFTVKIYARGKYKAFEVSGDSMFDGSIESVPDGCTVLCREIKRELWSSKLHVHKYPNWVFVHRTEGILVKRIREQNLENGDITLCSLNKAYKDRTINLNDVYAIYNVVKRELD